MNRERWTVRWRLTVWNSAVLTLLFCLFSIAMLFAVHQHLIYQADQVMQEELHELIEDFHRNADDSGAMSEQLQRRYSVHSDFHFQVLNADQQPIFRSRYLTNLELPLPKALDQLRGPIYDDIDLPEGKFRLLSLAIRDSHSRPLLMQVVTPRSALRQEFSWYWGTLLTALPIAILVSVGAGHLLARQALRPLDRMAGTANRISAENLSERLVLENPRDELGRLTVTLNEMFDRLQTSVAQMKQFTSDAAHELRSPIAALKTRVEVTLRSDRSSSEYRDVIQEVLQETNHMGELVDQLLVLSRHDSGQQTISFDEVRADVLLLDVLERFRTQADSRGQKLAVSELPPWVTPGDDIWLSLVFWNLLENASKYTDSGGEIFVEAEIREDRWMCSIRDTGRGIAEQHLPRIFDRFYRVDFSRTRSAGGTGLGLAICKSIVEAHHGTITVTSQVGVGSIFRVELPGSAAVTDSNLSGEDSQIIRRERNS